MTNEISAKAALAAFKVRAQPMVKDEQANLWRPVNTHHVDPLSIVTLEFNDGQYEIVAHRIADSKEILRCAITNDILYHEPTQSFHHWSICGGTQRHGLTFSNFAAAGKFRQQVQKIMAQVSTLSPNDISTDCTDGRELSQHTKLIKESGQLPPKRPQKPLSLLNAEEKPPETPPPRLPQRTNTPPSHSLPHSRSSASKPLPDTADTPLLPPRPSSTSHSPPHSAVRAIPTPHSALVSQRSHQIVVTYASRQGTARQPSASQTYTSSSLNANRTRQLEKYSDYREYDLPVQPKPAAAVPNRAETERASTSSIVSSVSTTDSLCTDSISIPLPTKGKRARNSSCMKNKEPTSLTERQLCKLCNESYCERDNVRGVCQGKEANDERAPALNCCLQRSASDSDGRCRSKKLLCILMPCIWCYKRCGQCNGQGNRNICCGSKHIPVKTKESPS